MSDFMTPDKCNETHKSVDAKLDEILEVLRGDMLSGKIGLVTKVNILWTVSLFLIMTVAGIVLRLFIA